MKFHLLFLSIIFHHYLFCQKSSNNYSIIINATTSVSDSEFIVNIHKSPNDIKIVYILRDSVDDISLEQNKYHTVYKDTLFKLFNDLSANRNTFTLYASKLDSLTKLYSYYRKDSILLDVKTNISYNNLLNKIVRSTREELENKVGNKNRVTLDGTSFRFNVITSNQDKFIYANSPRETSHPLLYQLISETLNIYRQTKNNMFLDKRITNGY